MKKLLLISFVVIGCILGFSNVSHAQFKEEAFQQNYNDYADSTATADTTDQLFSFKDWAGGISHKKSIKIGTMFAGAAVIPGTGQIYNKQYWKVPVVYGALGSFCGVGGYYRVQYNKSVKAHDEWTAAGDLTVPEPTLNTQAKTLSTWMFVGAGLTYWASLMDCTFFYDRTKHPLPGRATLYSLLLPGLGQAYNGEYWKIPIYQGGIIAASYFLISNDTNYKRFKWIHNQASESGYTGSISAETAKYYRDVYRRYRDYSILAVGVVYLLNVIDANVFAYMHDFEVSEDLSMQLEPTVITPDNAYAMSGRANITDSALGLRVGFRF